MSNIDEQVRPAIGDFIFTTVYRADPDEDGKFIGEDWVSWLKIGDVSASRTEEKVSRLMPTAKRPAGAIEWAAVKRTYEAWKTNQELPEDGTPLAAWPGCDNALVEALDRKSVRTVEAFASLPDTFVSGIPVPDIRRRQKAAKAFLEASKDRAGISAELQKRDDQIAELRKQIEGMTAPPSKAEAA